MSEISFSSGSWKKSLALPAGVILAVLIGWLTGSMGIAIPATIIGLILLFVFLVAIFKEPKLAITTCLFYSFILLFLIREVADLPFMYAIEALLMLGWAAALLHNRKKYNWSLMKNDLIVWGIVWVFYNFMELDSAEPGSVLAWMVDVRYPIWWLMLTPLSMVIFNTEKDLNFFLKMIIFMSLIAALVGHKQLYWGLWPGEKAFLAGEGGKTHLLFGKLRVFSFYSDAGQFGASQAQISTMALILALGPFKAWKRILLFIAACILFYGMMISGTRGAIFAFLSSMVFALAISRNLKIILFGLGITLCIVVGLKFTHLGAGIYEIDRMRTALDPQDASLNVRFNNQKKLAKYLESRPFGAGVGAMGYAARNFNDSTYIGTIPPDSYWVLVWGMYGIVGFLIWVCAMTYIQGKSAGIVWNIKNERLKYKLLALAAGSFGIFFSSYGNEVINFTPSSIVIYISWAFLFLGPRLDVNDPELQISRPLISKTY
jgi:hypothetical protein